jgi:hypothetical protein
MNLDADPEVLRRAADRLTDLAGDLLAVAHRLPEPTSGPRSGPLLERCADLADGLRLDAAELLECARRIGDDRAALLAGEVAALDALTAVHRTW